MRILRRRMVPGLRATLRLVSTRPVRSTFISMVFIGSLQPGYRESAIKHLFGTMARATQTIELNVHEIANVSKVSEQLADCQEVLLSRSSYSGVRFGEHF